MSQLEWVSQKIKIEENPRTQLALSRVAVEKFPDKALGHMTLGESYLKCAQYEEALSSFQRACQLDGQNSRNFCGLAQSFFKLDRHTEALEAYQKARSLDNTCPISALGEVSCYEELEWLDKAMRAAEKALERFPKIANLWSTYASILLREGHPKEALNACLKCLELRPGDPRALSLLPICHQVLNNTQEVKSLLNYEKLVWFSPLQLPEGEAQEDFQKSLLTSLKSRSYEYEPAGLATRRGHQTEVIENPDAIIRLLSEAFKDAVQRYVQSLPTDSAHPFLSRRPKKVALDSWAVVLEDGGHQAPHIHRSGWISGVYYAQVPNAIKENYGPGWLELGRLPRAYKAINDLPVHTVGPRDGLLVLFPSHFYHSTVPLESGYECPRICVAFDVRPVVEA